jgi:hypothetical protein
VFKNTSSSKYVGTKSKIKTFFSGGGSYGIAPGDYKDGEIDHQQMVTRVIMVSLLVGRELGSHKTISFLLFDCTLKKAVRQPTATMPGIARPAKPVLCNYQNYFGIPSNNPFDGTFNHMQCLWPTRTF